MLDMPGALSVLHPSIGEFLEHCQLRRDPRYKATWDTSYPMSSDDFVKELVRVPPPIPNGSQALPKVNLPHHGSV